MYLYNYIQFLQVLMKELEIKGTDYKVTTPERQKAKKVGHN